ncbi:hypothetical protein DJ83_11385, partial [Halorubrum ezzemoulense]
GSGAPGDIDFGEPFDDRVDVLSAPSARSEGDASADVGEGFSAADPETDETADAEADGGAVGSGGEADSDDREAESDDAESASADDADGAATDDIDDWGFGAVEPAEEG